MEHIIKAVEEVIGGPGLRRHTELRVPRPLTWVGSTEVYGEYVDAEGTTFYLGNGTGLELVQYLGDLDLTALWLAYHGSRTTWVYSGEEFRAIIRHLLIDPDYADDLDFCVDCNLPDHVDELCWTGHETRVCETCLSNYSLCSGCEERFTRTTTTLDGSEVCEGCRSEHWSYCESCDGYYADDGDHYHDEDDEDDDCDQQCSSPALSFAVRNDGREPLANDTLTTITLPAGTISAEGIAAIAGLLRINVSWLEMSDPDRIRMNNLSYDLEAIGDKWQAKGGNYTKRLSSYAYKTHQVKLTPAILSEVGNIASNHSRAVNVQVAVTRDLNQPRSHFAHSYSCWWTDYFQSRCTLKTNGGFGLRSFNANGDVIGRAWVMPMKVDSLGSLTPTFDTETAAAFVVFNGYGDLEEYAAPRIMAQMVGLTYRKIGFTVEPMYINNKTGFLIAPEEIAADYTDGSLDLILPQHANLYETEKEFSNV